MRFLLPFLGIVLLPVVATSVLVLTAIGALVLTCWFLCEYGRCIVDFFIDGFIDATRIEEGVRKIIELLNTLIIPKERRYD